MISARLALAAAMTALLLALGGLAAGCGDDDEPATTATTPTGPTGPTREEKIGGGDQGNQGESKGGKPDEQGTADESGSAGLETTTTPEPPPVDEAPPQETASPPPEEGPGPSGEEDTAENDIPPEPGSPEEAFEKYCDENPGACG